MTQRTFNVSTDANTPVTSAAPVTDELINGGPDAVVIVATLRGTAGPLDVEHDIQGFGPTAAEALASAYNLWALTHTMREVQQQGE